MKRAVVTGAGGFIGSHLAEHLVRSGFRVRAFVHYRATGTRGWLDESELAPEIEFVAGDVRDHDSVRRLIEGAGGCFGSSLGFLPPGAARPTREKARASSPQRADSEQVQLVGRRA